MRATTCTLCSGDGNRDTSLMPSSRTTNCNCAARSAVWRAARSALTSAKPLTAAEVVLAFTVAEQDAVEVDEELVLLLVLPDGTVLVGGGGGGGREAVGRACTRAGAAAAKVAIATTAKDLQR